MVAGRTTVDSRSETGSALVELAVALPMLMLLLVGTADFARVLYMTIELTNAARAGAQFGATDVGSSVDGAGIQSTAAAAAPDVVPLVTSVNPLATAACMCATDSGTFSGGGSCYANCGSSGHMVIFVQADASKTFTTIAGIPGVPRTLNVHRRAQMRVP